jgi:hypothetical protein
MDLGQVRSAEQDERLLGALRWNLTQESQLKTTDHLALLRFPEKNLPSPLASIPGRPFQEVKDKNMSRLQTGAVVV